MDSLTPVIEFIPDAGATVVLIVFMILWHRRTKARDEQFHETLVIITKSLAECMKATGEISGRNLTPRS